MKKKGSALSNVMLLQYLPKMKIASLELVGVDGNYCITKTVLEGVKKGFTILCNECCTGANDKIKFERTKLTLLKKVLDMSTSSITKKFVVSGDRQAEIFANLMM